MARWTAVDLITVALLGVVWRVLWYFSRSFQFVFPWNHPLGGGFLMILPLAVAIGLIRKPGVATLYYLSWMLFNLAFQGEAPLSLLVFLPVGIVADLYLWYKRDSMDKTSTIVVACLLTGLVFGAILYPMYVYYFLLPVGIGVWAAVLAVSMVTTAVAAVIGAQFARKVRPLLR
jgi:hypothetical protein